MRTKESRESVGHHITARAVCCGQGATPSLYKGQNGFHLCSFFALQGCYWPLCGAHLPALPLISHGKMLWFLVRTRWLGNLSLWNGLILNFFIVENQRCESNQKPVARTQKLALTWGSLAKFLRAEESQD